MVSGQLLVIVSHDSDEEMLGEELRGAEVEMRVDPVLVVVLRISSWTERLRRVVLDRAIGGSWRASVSF